MSTQDHTTKRCPRCKESYPITAEFWHRNKAAPDGFSGYCKSCRKIMKKQDYDNNRDKILARKKIYHIENRDKRADYHREYRIKNRETLLPKKRQYHADHKEEILEKKRVIRSEQNVIVNARIREWAKNNPDKVREKWVRHRARKHNAPGSHTQEQIAILYNEQQGKCFHCGIELNGKFQEDHWIPLTNPYTSDDISNIRLMCQKCNGSKGNKLAWVWHPDKYEKPDNYPE